MKVLHAIGLGVVVLVAAGCSTHRAATDVPAPPPSSESGPALTETAPAPSPDVASGPPTTPTPPTATAAPPAESPAPTPPAAPKTAEAPPPLTPAPAPKSADVPATPAPAPSRPTPPAPAPPKTAAVPKQETRPASPAPPPLDLAGLEKRLRDTKAIGVFTKLSLKNQVDDLIADFKAFHDRRSSIKLEDLRERYNGLMLKVLSLLQRDDPPLARDLSASREALWTVLTDPVKFAQVSGGG